MVQADGGYGDITAFRTGLEERELEYVVQVKGVTSAQPADAVPVAPSLSGPRTPAYGPLSRQAGQPRESWCSPPAVSRCARSGGARGTAARSPASSSRCGSVQPTTPNARTTAYSPSGGCWPSGPKARTSRSSTGSPTSPTDTPIVTLVQPREAPLAGRARLPRAQAMPRPRSLRGPHLLRAAAPPHLRHRRARVPDLLPPRPAATPTPPALSWRQPDQSLPSPARPPDHAGLLARALPDLPARAAAITQT